MVQKSALTPLIYKTDVKLTVEQEDAVVVKLERIVDSSVQRRTIMNGRNGRMVTIDHSASDKKTVENLREETINQVSKRLNISIEEAEAMLPKPEDVSMPLHGFSLADPGRHAVTDLQKLNSSSEITLSGDSVDTSFNSTKKEWLNIDQQAQDLLDEVESARETEFDILNPEE